MEWLEQLAGDGLRDAGAAVDHIQQRASAGFGMHPHRDPRRLAGQPPVDQGVVHQHGRDLLQLPAIDQAMQGRGGGAGFQQVVLQGVAGAVVGDELPREFAEVHVLRLRALALGQAEHVLDDPVHALGLLQDDLQQAAIGSGDVRRLLHQLGGVADRGQGVADFVGQAGREPAQGGEGQRLRALGGDAGVVQEHQRLVVAGAQPGEARQHFGQAGRQLQGLRVQLAVVHPFAQAPVEGGGRLRQWPLVQRVAAQQQGGGLVGQGHPAHGVHQQDPGAHPPDDQFVHLGEIRDLGAAALGQCFGRLCLAPEQVGERGDRQVADREHRQLGQRVGGGDAVDQRPAVLDRERDRRQRGHPEPQAQGQQHGGGTDVEQQHHRDAGARLRQRMHRQRGGDDVDQHAGQRLPLDMTGASGQEQGHRQHQVAGGDGGGQRRMARRGQQRGHRPEHHQAKQCRLEDAVQGEEIEFAPDGGRIGHDGEGAGQHRPKYAAGWRGCAACRSATR